MIGKLSPFKALSCLILILLPASLVADEPTPVISANETGVTFVNSQAGITLQGSIVLPNGQGPFPVAEYIPAPGPIRDNGPQFTALTQELIPKGVAVFWFDDRGTGENPSDFKSLTTQDFADDVTWSVKYLQSRKDINPERIGLIGHSEGGLIASMVAADTKDLAFIVLMAGPAVSGYQIDLRQQEAEDKFNGVDEKHREIRQRILKRLMGMVIQGKEDKLIKAKVKDIVQEEMGSLGEADHKAYSEERDYWQDKVNRALTPWTRFFIRFDPKTCLSRVTCPVLALIGDKDWKVPADDNFPAIKEFLKEAKNQDYTLKLLPNIGHGFGTARNAQGEAMGAIQPIAEEVLALIGNWVEKHTK